MAKPVTTLRPQSGGEAVAEERLLELRQQAAQHAEGLLESLRLLQAMHDREALQLLTALFERGDQVLQLALGELNQPGAVNGIRNVLTLIGAIGQVDPALTRHTATATTAGIHAAAEAAAKSAPMGVFDLLRHLKDPDVAAGLGAALAFLKAFGQGLRTTSAEADQT
ncbi:MAG: DUF1641 domain-containing protein [Alicyclobacillus sp.]|nr:DUF1641 domain-containing protein [Alicyclobacillus sp.]